jgi:hypothetical protein
MAQPLQRGHIYATGNVRLPNGEYEALYPFEGAPALKASMLIFVSVPPEEETGLVCTTVDGKGNVSDRPLNGGSNFIPHPANGLSNMTIKNGNRGTVRLAYMVFERLPDHPRGLPVKKKRPKP